MNVSKGNRKRCIIITSNVQFDIRDMVEIQAGDLILCADGGWEKVIAAGITPDVVIGDFDSLSGSGLDKAIAAGIAPNAVIGDFDSLSTSGLADAGLPKMIRLPTEKDETDTLACVKYGLTKGYEDFCVIGGLSGRFDHTFANIQTLSYLADMGCSGWIIDDKNRATMLDCIRKSIYDFLFDIEVEGHTPDALGSDLEFCTPEEADRQRKPAVLTLEPVPNAGFAVFSYETRSTGVCIRNARYALNEAVLTQSFPVGVSNEFLCGKPAEISLRTGRLLIIVSKE
jgi:thiamine pyrophosphokinase